MSPRVPLMILSLLQARGLPHYSAGECCLFVCCAGSVCAGPCRSTMTPEEERTFASNPGHYTGYTWAVRWDPVTRLLYSLEGSECVIRSLHERGRVLVNPTLENPVVHAVCARRVTC